MNKIKLVVFAGSAAMIAAVSMLAAQASTPLAVTCAGNVSGTVVMWTASPTGGNSPYMLLWGGDASVAGSTSTAMNVTYGTNGTYNATIQATDASSTVATSTCQAIVTANVVPVATSTLNVFVSVNNSAGGSAVPASFIATVSGAGANPSSFSGNASGTAVTVNASTSYSVGASAVANYTAGTSGNCSGPIAAGTSASCTVTETFVPSTPTPTSTPPLPRANQPTLSIGEHGQFLSRGMTVTSVSSGSFQAQVWGITYAVNWSGSFLPEFFFRKGNKASSTTNLVNQLQVGDEVSVMGSVSASNPLVVNANVVRDFSITMPRPGLRRGQSDSPFYNGKGNGGGNENGQGENEGSSSASGSASATINMQSRLNDLLNQLHGLQGLFNGKGKGKGDH